MKEGLAGDHGDLRKGWADGIEIGGEEGADVMDDGNDKVSQDVVGVLLGHGILALQWSHYTKVQ